MQKVIVEVPTPIWAVVFMAITYALDSSLREPSVFRQPEIGTLVIVAALAFAGWAIMLFRSRGTEIQPSSASNKLLVTDGPFGVSRNPMYVSMVTLTLGVALLVGTPLMYAVPVALFLLDNFIIIPFEEAKMERQFGNSFGAYKQKVRRWL